MDHADLPRHLDEMTPWQDSSHLLEVVAVTDEAPEVKTYTFGAEPGVWFRYRPGQFITVDLPTAEGSVMRTYTLSSSPSRPLSIAITVKAQPASLGTRWMFDNLKVGSRVRALGPAGGFTNLAYPSSRYLFISAGSGVTPLMSMLRWLSDCSPGTDIAFVHCARRPEDILFRKEIELLARSMPGLSLSFVVADRPVRQGWSGHVGRIDAARLAMLVPDVLGREVFCCGPGSFMAAIAGFLGASGFDMTRYHQESFGEAAGAGTSAVPVPVSVEDGTSIAKIFPVRFARSETNGECPPGRTVLQAARAAGVRISAACESGLCGTCKVLKLDGEVEMAHNGGILNEEIADGYILACCSRPLTEIVVDV